MAGTFRICYDRDIKNMLWQGHSEYVMAGTLRICYGRDIEDMLWQEH